MAAQKGKGGKFVKKTAPVKMTKFTASDDLNGMPSKEYETDLTDSELDVFKARMRRQYAAESGLDADYVTIS